MTIACFRPPPPKLASPHRSSTAGYFPRYFRYFFSCLANEFSPGSAAPSDRRLAKPSPKRVPAAKAQAIEELYRTRYQGFTAKHFHEHAVRNHGLRWGYTWTKSYLQERGHLKKAPRRGAHRRKRERRPLPGMMLHQDGSRHCWVPGLGQELDLI